MKKHVFPVCSPNLLEFSKENTTLIYTEDLTNIADRLFYTDGSWGQLLIGEASHEEWTPPGTSPGDGWFYIGFTTGAYGTNPVLEPPPPGTVICVGNKDKLTSTFDSGYASSRSSTPLPRSVWADFGVNFTETKTNESQADFYADPYWVTYMWSGSTWHLLGSNNWV